MAHKSFLTLVNDLASEAGASGNASSVATVVNQTGVAKRLVGWIRQAHNDIQNRHQNWRWMRSAFSVNTVIGTDTYAPTTCTDTRLTGAITRFARWIPYADDGSINIKRFLTSTGVSVEGYMNILPWSYFRAIYRIGTQNNGPITNITVDPQDNLITGPKPDNVYTITGEYQMSSLNFANDADTAEFPERFDDLITYEAMKKYGAFYAATEVFQRGDIEGGRLMRQLEANQLPQVVLAPPLA
jgi:hypothetical protein